MKPPNWSVAEDRILELNSHVPPRELVAMLPGRTRFAIEQRRLLLGLRFENPRRKAAALGHMKYQGAPCKHGHSGLRYSATGCCIECNAIRKQRKAA